MADFMSGLRSSSTLLLFHSQLSLRQQTSRPTTYRLKCCIDSPGLIVSRAPLPFPAVPVLPSDFLRLPSRSPSSPSSSLRFLSLKSSRILLAFKIRDADFGIGSLVKESFSGAQSVPLPTKACQLRRNSDLMCKSNRWSRTCSLVVRFARLCGMESRIKVGRSQRR